MTKTINFICGLILLATFCQCSQPPKEPQDPILGEYDLTAYDKSGVLVFTGTIRLETREQNHLKGQCTIAKEKNAPKNIFDQNGRCEALLEGKAISFDLAPLMDDGGVLYEAELNDGKITGVWMLDSYGGSVVLGRIQAVKRKN